MVRVKVPQVLVPRLGSLEEVARRLESDDARDRVLHMQAQLVVRPDLVIEQQVNDPGDDVGKKAAAL